MIIPCEMLWFMVGIFCGMVIAFIIVASMWTR